MKNPDKARSAAKQAVGPASPGISVGLDVMTPGRFKTGATKTRMSTLLAMVAALALPMLAQAQDAASHADPRTTMRYDRARQSLDRHATYIVAAFVAGASRTS